jgi:hypothetical protein
MKASEILRKLADVIDNQATAAVNGGEHNRGTMEPVEVDNTDHTEGYTFVAPLQQKLELLKKATGVDSIYDEPCEACGQTPCGCEDADSEMDIMKRNAGIGPVVLQIASDDEPLDM